MTLYCVEDQYDYESNTLLGVFSTLELAENFLNKIMDYSGSPDRYFVSEVILDEPITCNKLMGEWINVKHDSGF